jgi:hypothetical protein
MNLYEKKSVKPARQEETIREGRNATQVALLSHNVDQIPTDTAPLHSKKYNSSR